MGSLRLYTFKKKPQWLVFVHAGNVTLTGTPRKGLTSFLGWPGPAHSRASLTQDSSAPYNTQPPLNKGLPA